MRVSTIFLVLLFSGHVLADEPDTTSNAIVLSEYIFDAKDVSFPSCHASTIVETKEGLLVAWFAGTKEKDPDVGIWLSQYLHGEWSVPVEVANGVRGKAKQFPTWNPVLFNTGKEIKLFYKVGPSPREWWGEVKTSVDNGLTWSLPLRLPKNIFGPIKNKPLKLADGKLLCPSSTENEGWRVHMEFYTDMDKTWERTDALNDGNNISLIQPAILTHSDNAIQILCRSMNGAIFSSWSNDNGYTWSEFETIGLPNPNSGFDAVTLKDGRHILVYNHIACKTGEKWGDRNILNIAISDDGKLWKAAELLENDKDEDAEYSYPAGIQTNDGNVHITYTWNRTLIKHVVLDPLKINTKDIINGIWPLE
ncbi:MAG: exo-alpha-sialidase [Bacteroidetes bacterium]|nr:exo-alpha-sialidase [Bacteroidota bacterium]